MGLVSISIAIFLLVSCFHQLICRASDRLSPGQSNSVNQTVISAGGVFALGFFMPSNSTTNRYLGVWYNNLPERTVVWVANRDNPLADSAGVLTITDDRNVAVLNEKGTILWSSNVSNVQNNTAAILLDSGNLVLRQGEGSDIWQSFDYPTDTFLPYMFLRSNFKTGIAQRMTSWKNAQDPSPGGFSLGFDPRTSRQFILWRGSEPLWRSQVWNGRPVGATRDTNTTTQYFLEVVATDEEEISFTFNPIEVSVLARYVLDPMGTLKMMFWLETSKNWTMIWSTPSKPCDGYDRCGPSGTCNSSGNSAICKCLQGFEPKSQNDWNVGNYSGGCVRRVSLKCDKDDKFLKLERLKLPDKFTSIRNASAAQCEAECLNTCQCTAYAYVNVSDVGSSSSCLVWVGELMDLEQVVDVWEDLNVRLVASELVDNALIDAYSNKDGHLLVILLPILATGMLFLVICGYCLKRKMIKKGKRNTSKAVMFGNGNGKDVTELPFLDFSNVVAATDNFSAANKLGEGGFGPVYMGNLQGEEIAVKMLSKSSGQGNEEFKNEIELIAKLQHTNLVRLLGWSMHEDEKLLIYEYLPNKSLDKFIFDPTQSAELKWGRRFHIIEGIAQGLLYLHRYSRLRIIHRDLKTSNILLDGAMNPKISDFGLARIFGGTQTEANTKRVVGTYGYMSPEYALDGLFSEKSDVFSFGVIVLEIVSGRRSTGFYPYKESLNLLGYAWLIWEEERGLELMDQTLGSTLEAPEVMRCIQVALLCIQENAADRPKMSSVVSMLGNETATLPSPKQPAFTIGRNQITTNFASGSGASKESINEVTISGVEGR